MWRWRSGTIHHDFENHFVDFVFQPPHFVYKSTLSPYLIIFCGVCYGVVPGEMWWKCGENLRRINIEYWVGDWGFKVQTREERNSSHDKQILTITILFSFITAIRIQEEEKNIVENNWTGSKYTCSMHIISIITQESGWIKTRSLSPN